jgi:hypothetical protein
VGESAEGYWEGLGSLQDLGHLGGREVQLGGPGIPLRHGCGEVSIRLVRKTCELREREVRQEERRLEVVFYIDHSGMILGRSFLSADVGIGLPKKRRFAEMSITPARRCPRHMWYIRCHFRVNIHGSTTLCFRNSFIAHHLFN